MKRLFNWLDQRTGYRADLRKALDEPVPGGARWAYVFGSCLAVLLVVQAVTGILLATVYSPSATQVVPTLTTLRAASSWLSDIKAAVSML